METHTDQTYIEQCLDGDREAFRELVVRYQSRVIGTIYRMVHDPEAARDLTQEVFVKAFTRLNTYDARYPFKVWITRIATYHTIDFLRRKRPEYPEIRDEQHPDRPGVIDMASSKEPTPEERIWRKERAGIISRALQSLDPKLRAVVVLRHYEDLNYDEIADALNIPLGTVKNRLFRAREKLQELILENHLTVQEVVS